MVAMRGKENKDAALPSAFQLVVFSCFRGFLCAW